MFIKSVLIGSPLYQTFENVINGIQRSIIRNTKKDYAQNLLESALTGSDDWQVIADGNEFIELATGESSTVGDGE